MLRRTLRTLHELSATECPFDGRLPTVLERGAGNANAYTKVPSDHLLKAASQRRYQVAEKIPALAARIRRYPA